MGFCPGKVKKLKCWVVETIFPIFQEDEEETWILSWSPQSQSPIRVAPVRKFARSGQKSWLIQDAYTNSRGLRSTGVCFELVRGVNLYICQLLPKLLFSEADESAQVHCERSAAHYFATSQPAGRRAKNRSQPSRPLADHLKTKPSPKRPRIAMGA